MGVPGVGVGTVRFAPAGAGGQTAAVWGFFSLLLLLCVCIIIKDLGKNAAWAPGEVWECQAEVAGV